MFRAFKAILEEAGLTRSGSRILLAVSGGMDSMCMASLFSDSGLEFAVAHCNFHLRGEESDGDEALVRQWSENHGVEFHKTDFDTLSFARERGLSIEMAARELRYRWFAELCKSFGYNYLAVAHNANDNAETLYLNLARGTGLEGLTGMSRLAPLPYSGDNSSGQEQCVDNPLIIRPMLGFTRKQIEGYVFSRHLAYREDSTNQETEYKRNRIRHLVFPVMEQINPSFIKTANREMGYFSQAAAIARSYSESALLRAVSADGLTLSLQALENEPHRDYVLYVFLSKFGFNSSVIASVTSLMNTDGTFAGKYFRSESHELVTGSDSLIVRPLSLSGSVVSSSSSDFSGTEGSLCVQGEGDYEFGGRYFQVEVLPRTELSGLKQPEGVLIFDAAVLKFPFHLRRWKSGDWFRPFGSGGRKKVSDFFTDKKYDCFRKEAAVILVQNISDAHIAAILGERSDDAYKVSDGSDIIIRISVI